MPSDYLPQIKSVDGDDVDDDCGDLVLPSIALDRVVEAVLNPNQKNKRPVPSRVLQKRAEQIWATSGGKWGTPPGVPLITYDEMCKTKGILEVSPSTKWITK